MELAPGWPDRPRLPYLASRALAGRVLAGRLDRVARAYPSSLTPAKPGEPQPAFQPLVYALDTLLPVVNLHQEDNWLPRGSAQWWAWSSILVGWVLTAAAAAAFTGVLKRD